MITKIRNEKQYNQVMSLIEEYLQKATNLGGFQALSKAENDELKKLSLLAEDYEDTVLQIMPIKPSIGAIVEQKLKEKNLTQKALAEMFAMSRAKISQILSGKRQADIEFLKATHEKLGIDGNLLLELV